MDENQFKTLMDLLVNIRDEIRDLRADACKVERRIDRRVFDTAQRSKVGR